MNKDGFVIVQAGLEYSLLLNNGKIYKSSFTKICVFIIIGELLWHSSLISFSRKPRAVGLIPVSFILFEET